MFVYINLFSSSASRVLCFSKCIVLDSHKAFSHFDSASKVEKTSANTPYEYENYFTRFMNVLLFVCVNQSFSATKSLFSASRYFRTPENTIHAASRN